MSSAKSHGLIGELTAMTSLAHTDASSIQLVEL